MTIRKSIILAVLMIAVVIVTAVVWNYFLKPPFSVPKDEIISANEISNQKSPPPPIAKKAERNSKLQSQTDSLLHLFNRMPPVPVYLTGEPIIKNGSNIERGVAYTDCGTEHLPEIYLKKSFYEKTNQKQLTNILKHELTHAWQCRRGVMSGHDAEFRKKFTEAGGFGN